LHQDFCGEEDCRPVPWGRKFRVPKEGNAHNLPADYYERLTASLPPEMRIRYVDGECGPDLHGRPVFPDFSSQLHSGDLEYHPALPVLRGWDFGRQRPAVVWGQVHPNGCLNILNVKMGENVLLDTFADQVLTQSAIMFPRTQVWFDFGDPHGAQKREMSEETPIDLLRRKGIQVRYRDTSVRFGLDAIGRMLTTLVDKRPRLMVHRRNCNILVEAFAGGYTWPEYKPGKTETDRPYPDGYYEHPMDALRYLVVGVTLGMAGNGTDAKVQFLRWRR